MRNFEALLEDFLKLQRVVGKAPRTLERYKFNLRLLRKWGGDRQLDKETFREFILFLKEKGYSAWSVNSAITTSRVFARYLYQEKGLLEEDFSHLLKFQRTEPFNPVLLSDQEIKAIFSFERRMSPQHSWFDSRKYSFCLELMARCGLRVDETLNLKVGDLNFANQTFRVIGKGRVLRTVSIPSIMSARLLSWVLERRAEPTDWLFQGVKGNQMGYRSLVDELKKRARLLGIRKRIHPHLFRHCFVTSCIRANLPTAKIMKAVGHRSLQTHLRYTHLVHEDIIEVFEELPLNRETKDQQEYTEVPFMSRQPS